MSAAMWMWRALGGKTPLHAEVEVVQAAVDAAEARLAPLRQGVGELRHAGLDPQALAMEKAALIAEWDGFEDELMALLQTIDGKRRGMPEDEQALVAALDTETARVHDLIMHGGRLLSSLSAVCAQELRDVAAAAAPDRFRGDDWLVAVASMECDETKCRIEYERGEGVCWGEVYRLHTVGWAQARNRGGGGVADDATESAITGGACIPRHWGRTGWAVEGDAEVVDVTETMQDAVGALLEGVGDVRRVRRVESARLWSEFAVKREQLRQYQHEIEAGAGAVVAETDLLLSPYAPFPEVLEAAVNEKWLFLPCRTEGDAEEAARAGLSRARKTNGLYGPNLHLYDSPAQADAAGGGAEPCVVLCRAALGRYLPCDAPLKTLPAAYSSIVAMCRRPSDPRLRPAGSSAAWLDAHREFVLHNTALAYPAYIVSYRRASASLAFNPFS